MTGQIPEGSGETSQLYPCIESSTQECQGEAWGKQMTNDNKTAHCQKPVSLNKLDNPSSPGNARECRLMPVVTGKKQGKFHKRAEKHRNGTLA